jgi:hypothetical protein
VLGVGLFRAREFDQLDFLELVLADDAARVFAGCTGLGAKAGRVGRERDGQRLVTGTSAVGMSQWSLKTAFCSERAAL